MSKLAPPPTADPSNKRIATLDVLRGVALLGILTVHTGMIGSPQYILGYIPLEAGLLDTFAIRLVRHSAEAVLYLLFSFMFGIGLAMQSKRAAKQGDRSILPHVRRMVILFIIGVAHTVLLWDGDILKIYGAVGLIILFDKWLKSWMLLAMASATFLLMIFYLGGEQYIPLIPQPAGTEITQPAHVDAAIDLYTNGSYVELVSSRWDAISGIFVAQVYLSIGVIFALLLGLYVGRIGLFDNIKQNLRVFRRIFFIALIPMIGGNILYLLSESTRDVMTYRLGFHLSGAGLCFMYISGVTLLMETDFGRKLLMPFAAVGKLSITNYIMQTVIQVTLFYSLGWYNTQSRFALLMLAFIIFALQVVYSQWWDKRYRLGPLEWVWRSLTYGQLQPLIR